MHEHELETQVAAVPLYERIKRTLYAEIVSGQLKPGQQLNPPEKLATQLGVSSGTIRHALQLLASHGFLVRKPHTGTFVSNPFPLENSKASPDSKPLVYAMFPDVRMREQGQVLVGIHDAAKKIGINTVVISTNDEIEQYHQAINQQIEEGSDGMIIVPPFKESMPMDVLLKLQKSKIPVVTCYRRLISPTDWPLVSQDLFGDTYAIAEHLAKMGRRRIALIAYEELPERFAIRHYAFMNALLNSNAPVDCDLKLSLDNEVVKDSLRVYEVIKSWLREHRDIDAICCGGDRVASVVIKALTQIGKKIPDDVAVTGGGNMAEDYGFFPGELTTYDVGFESMGKEALRILIAMQKGEQFKPQFESKITGRIVLGRSTTGQIDIQHDLSGVVTPDI